MDLDQETSAQTQDLLRALEEEAGARCRGCGAALCGHQVLLSVAAGHKDAPRCLVCLADALEKDPQELRDQLFVYLQSRKCYRTAWLEASRMEGVEPGLLPSCLWGEAGVGTVSGEPATVEPARVEPAPAGSGPAEPDESWDAGDLGCGDLVLELKNRLASLEPGRIFLLTARDPGAPEDLPAWCRLTGHALLHARHPQYWIRRKEK